MKHLILSVLLAATIFANPTGHTAAAERDAPPTIDAAADGLNPNHCWALKTSKRRVEGYCRQFASPSIYWVVATCRKSVMTGLFPPTWGYRTFETTSRVGRPGDGKVRRTVCPKGTSASTLVRIEARW